ncbi:hypothetical protein PMZ80_008119 [Knufia obscura]|uniref:Uncharacterized protein n=1 Tax=Knufia obscura TaxID=1635080 RepID=A0ABR0RGI3_9EURO|nr:hypothetical protein PMZ80_008119 [Knufia obscura]
MAELNKQQRRDLITKRVVQLRTIFCEARLWASSILLPPDLISEEPEYYSVVLETTAALFGENFDEQTINRVYAKLGQNILLPGLDSSDQDSVTFFQPSDEDLIAQTDGCWPHAASLDAVFKSYPEFTREYSDLRTWRDLKARATGFCSPTNDLLKLLRCRQMHEAKQKLGLLRGGKWTSEERAEINDLLRSLDHDKIYESHNLDLASRDFIFVRTTPDPLDGVTCDTQASMNQTNNVMTLYSNFYDTDLVDGLSDCQIKEGITDVRDLVNTRTMTVLHEAGHSPSSITATDHILEYDKKDLLDPARGLKFISMVKEDIECATYDNVETLANRKKVQRSIGDPTKIRLNCYGFEACLDLTDEDDQDGTNQAEDNAETIALYGLSRQLILAYPDFDISIRNRKWIMTRRKRLVHHCSLHHCMRHKDAGSIRDHPDYQPEKDTWGQHTGKKLPSNIIQLLNVVIGLARDRLKEDEERAKRARDREELKRRMYGLKS